MAMAMNLNTHKILLKTHQIPILHTSFPAQNLVLRQNSLKFGSRRKKILRVCAAVKRRKEMSFDNVIQRDKKLKLVLKIRNILVNQPERIMALRHLGRYRKELGLTKKRRFIALLKRFPGVFEIVEEGAYSLRFRLTQEADSVYVEEQRIRNEMEGHLVEKLRKLLMMSLDKRILIEKIAHMKTDLGLPDDFRSTVCRRYPQYFTLVPTDRGPALELSHWDPKLAVSFAELTEEENREREMEDQNYIIDRVPKFSRVKLPKGLKLSKREMNKLSSFREIPCISPYADFSHLMPGTLEKERHACGVVHEILSLTLERRTLVDHLTHFREEFRFSQQLRGMLIRHPDMFYVSLKGTRDSVFLREAYHRSELIEKDKLLTVKEKLRSLVGVSRFCNRNVRRPKPSSSSSLSDGDDDNDNDDDDYLVSQAEGFDEGKERDDWSEIENVISDELDEDFDETDEDDDSVKYDEELDVDGWSDEEEEEDEAPPNIDDDDDEEEEEEEDLSLRRKKVINGIKATNKSEDKFPVLPDGKPRERW